MSNYKSVVAATVVVFLTTVVLLSATLLTTSVSVSAFPSGPSREMVNALKAVPMATSGNKVYMAWVTNDTGYCNVFFAKSTDGGKTLKTIIISAPNKVHTIDQNTEISASGSNVYVTWWTDKAKPGVLEPVFRASNDNGNTFGKPITLNSTG